MKISSYIWHAVLAALLIAALIFRHDHLNTIQIIIGALTASACLAVLCAGKLNEKKRTILIDFAMLLCVLFAFSMNIYSETRETYIIVILCLMSVFNLWKLWADFRHLKKENSD